MLVVYLWKLRAPSHNLSYQQMATLLADYTIDLWWNNISCQVWLELEFERISAQLTITYSSVA